MRENLSCRLGCGNKRLLESSTGQVIVYGALVDVEDNCRPLEDRVHGMREVRAFETTQGNEVENSRLEEDKLRLIREIWGVVTAYSVRRFLGTWPLLGTKCDSDFKIRAKP